MKEMQGHCHMMGGSMGKKTTVEATIFCPLFFPTHTIAVPHFTCPQDALLVLISKYTCSYCWKYGSRWHLELTGAWQCISHQHKEDAATADATFERVRFWFLWLCEIKSNSGDVNTAALPTKPSEDFFFLFSAHSRKKRERARISKRPPCLRALFTSCLSPVYHLALLLFYSSKTSLLFQVVHCMAIRGTVVALPLFNCSLQGLLACECVTSSLRLCCSFLSWVKPFSRLDSLSSRVSGWGILCGLKY